ncbi:MAG TPA: GIY-YIG nuclease family protein [Parafilimonas sp.]|nr:GIY-YIG nuclease family protein [Parafilimonas sp.]
MFYIYILYSSSSDKFYVGYSNDPWRRLIEHNSKPFNTFTSKYRPWDLKSVFACSENEGETMRIEKFIKKQKSKKLIQKLTEESYVPIGELALLVRVPHLRD